ncbi:hypothetical protein E2C01_053722 [Portunus trituberculatus]|uniref:Uncharacterized protein n=1 Tax=Portunus trituberculatus TaxID=210409 RepID=A0A5B7GR90_PORTR|nr:hypothetical protein [Portunus trituberculatus]
MIGSGTMKLRRFGIMLSLIYSPSFFLMQALTKSCFSVRLQSFSMTLIRFRSLTWSRDHITIEPNHPLGPGVNYS